MGIVDTSERQRRFAERYNMHRILRQGKKRPPPKSAQKEYCENLSREFAHSVSQAFLRVLVSTMYFGIRITKQIEHMNN